MADQKQVEMLKRSVEEWNRWREENPGITPDLSKADLSGANLSRADLGASLCGWTIFADVDLSKTKGLESVSHFGPSTIGIDTIYKSGGKIPEAFLRGAGVPENFITFMGSLTAKAIEFYSCFISYSTKDEEFAERVHADLQAKGVRCWFAAHDMQGGRKFHEQIDEAIRLYDKLLLILSKNSMDSNWVTAEILKARKREKQEKRTMLFPVSLVPYEDLQSWECFDDDSGEDMAREIRRFHIPNFSKWKTDNDGYKKAFDKLLRDLKSGEKQKV